MAITGDSEGSSHSNTDRNCAAGSETQPDVALPVDTWRNMALPRSGVRAALYAITAPRLYAGRVNIGCGLRPASWVERSTHSLYSGLAGSSSHTMFAPVTRRNGRWTPGS